MIWKPGEAGRETRKSDSDIGYEYPFENKWDVLQRENLPDGDNLGIDYRVAPEKERDSRYYSVYLLIVGVVITLTVIFFSHLFGDLYANEITFVIVIFIGVLVALWNLLAREEWPTVLLHGLIVPVIWLVITIPALFSPSILLLIGAVASIGLADSIATHYLMWLGADPNLSNEARTTIKEAWRRRWSMSAAKMGSIFLLIYVVLLLLFGGQIIDGVSLLIILTGMFAMGGTAFLVKRAGSFQSFLLFRDALVSWLTYGRFGTDSPGVFQSPRGGWPIRMGMTISSFILLTSAILPFSSYFPVVFIDSDKAQWVKLYADIEDNNFSIPRLLMKWNDYQAPSFREITLHRLTNAEALYLRRMNTASEQRFYLHKKQLADYLESSPGAWLGLVVDGFFTFKAQFFWAALLSFLGCLVFPLFIWGIILYIVSGEMLWRIASDIEAAKEPLKNDWEGYVRRLQTSPNILAQKHIWLGNHTTEDYPILLHEDVLREHAHILGDSGSGKSALAVAPLFTQLIRKNDSTVVIIDLKGDMALFEGVRKEAGDRFKYFTNEVKKSTYIFNPFSQLQTDNISVNQFCEVFLSALGLEHGEGYGRSYFSRVARDCLKQIISAFPDIRSFEELKEKIEDFTFAKRTEKNDAYELIAVIESLASFEQINFLDEARQEACNNAIYWPEAINKHQVVYFWLPAAIEVSSVREIAKLALHTLFTCASDYQRQHGNPGRIWLCIDEFQHIASLNFKLILQQARSMGLGVILANQSTSDLKMPGSDIRGTVQTNTRFKQYFSLSDHQEMEKVIEASGETLYFDIGKTGPRLTKNELIRISDAADESIVIVGRGKGYSQFGGFAFMLRSLYHIDEEEYAERNGALWPPGDEKTIVAVREHAEMPPDTGAVSFRNSNILVDSEVSLEDARSASEWGEYLNKLYIQQSQKE